MMESNSIREELKAKLVNDLVLAITNKATYGIWREEDCEEPSAEELAKRAMSMAMGAMGVTGVRLPAWFTEAARATQTVMSFDELKGLECVASLYSAALAAPESFKVAALEMLTRLVASGLICGPIIGIA